MATVICKISGAGLGWFFGEMNLVEIIIFIRLNYFSLAELFASAVRYRNALNSLKKG